MMDNQLKINGLLQELGSTLDIKKRKAIMAEIARLESEEPRIAEVLQDKGPKDHGASLPEKPVTGAPIPPMRLSLLGPNTTGLEANTTICLSTLPTGIYHLLDPKESPLASVRVKYVSRSHGDKAKRVCVIAWIDGYSAKQYQTKEIERDNEATYSILPNLLPNAVSRMTQMGRCTLQIEVVDLDAKIELQESHTIPFLAAHSGITYLKNIKENKLVKMTHYYGAWVTPHAEAVQKILRKAADISVNEYGAILGYQLIDDDNRSVEKQVSAIFNILKNFEIKYVSSSGNFRTPDYQWTQKVRLPKESLEFQSINCLDGALLWASLLEAAGLYSALFFTPSHAFVGWKADPRSHSDDWKSWTCMETTALGNTDFGAACDMAKAYIEEDSVKSNIWKEELPILRSRGIFPME